jgi:hypothetical protein
MAAFYAFELATAFHDGLFVEPESEDEPDILEQALAFGYDHVISCLVIEAGRFLDKVEVTTKAFFALESIISLAKEKVNKSVPLLCYALSTDLQETKNLGEIVHVTQGYTNEPKIRELCSLCSFEIQVGSLLIRTDECPRKLVPLVESILLDPSFLSECATRCSIGGDSWTPVATFHGVPTRKLDETEMMTRIPQRPRDYDTRVIVFSVTSAPWVNLHPLNNALMGLTRVLRQQMQEPCSFFATHPDAKPLRLSMACGDWEAERLQPQLMERLNKKFPHTFAAVHDEVFQVTGPAHLFMFCWSSRMQGKLKKLAIQCCGTWQVRINTHDTFCLEWQ